MPETAQEHCDFKWVKVRASWTVASAFDRLREGVTSDLEELRSCEPRQAEGLERGRDEGTFFNLACENRGFGVAFKKLRDAIEVSRYERNDEMTLMKLSVVLTDEGECRFKDEGGEVWWPWQVRQQALEELFFGAG